MSDKRMVQISCKYDQLLSKEHPPVDLRIAKSMKKKKKF